VPGLGGGGGGPLLLPPPQAVLPIANTHRTSDSAAHDRKLRDGMPVKSTPANRNPAARKVTVLNRIPLSAAADGAVVRMLRTVVPVPITLTGLKEHVARLGNPVHEAEVKLMVLAYPVCPVMFRVLVTVPPWDTDTLLLAGAKVKSALTLTVMGPEVDGEKLLSPLYWAVMVFAPFGRLETARVVCVVKPLALSCALYQAAVAVPNDVAPL
jgi:hypothetical protein